MASPHRAPTDSLEDALARCYRALGRRDHSVAEMRASLQRARLDPEAVDRALATLIAQGYLDDERYARALIGDRRSLAGWGVERIRARLEAAEIDRELIERVLAGLDAASELAAATALLERRYELPLDDPRDRRRAWSLLLRNGFQAEVADDAVRAAGARDVRT